MWEIAHERAKRPGPFCGEEEEEEEEENELGLIKVIAFFSSRFLLMILRLVSLVSLFHEGVSLCILVFVCTA